VSALKFLVTGVTWSFSLSKTLYETTSFFISRIICSEIILFQYDPVALQFCFDSLSTSDAGVIMHVYNQQSSPYSVSSPSTMNPFGNFTYANFSLSQFVIYMTTYEMVAPDGFTDLLSSRCCSYSEK
jgi:hypothetical protein